MNRSLIKAGLTGALLSVCLPAVFGQRVVGDSAYVAPVPSPGFPEGIMVHGDKFYVAGPAYFPPVGFGTIFEYDLATGALLSTISLTGEKAPSGTSNLAFDDAGNLYCIVAALGVVRIDLTTRQQSIYAPPPPIKYKSSSPDGSYLMNDMSFDGKGDLYLTDSFQATIWRIPKGGGPMQEWLHDDHLNSFFIHNGFGLNGIRIDRANQMLYVDQTTDATLTGYLYRIRMTPNPTYADLEILHVWPYTGNGSTYPVGPDGIELSASGKVYVALPGVNQIAVVDPNIRNIFANQTGLYGGPGNTGDPKNPLPWVGPASMSFDTARHRLLFTNHASLYPAPVPPVLFAVLDLFVDETGPVAGPTLTATPNPILAGGAFFGTATINWNAPAAQIIEVRVGGPSGALFTHNINNGSMATGPWVTNGLTFYLQDVTGGKTLTSENTLATVTINLK